MPLGTLTLSTFSSEYAASPDWIEYDVDCLILQATLLVHDLGYLPLYARLGVLTLSKDQLLARLLLPRWAQLPDSARSAVLRCVQLSWLDLKENTELVSVLGRTPFVVTGMPLKCWLHCRIQRIGAVSS